MAIGDVVFFDQFLVDVQKKLHDLSSDTLMVGLITAVATPAATDADPRWGAGGTTNYLTNEVTPGGNYATGGVAIATPTVTLTAGAAVFDGGDISITQNASNPTNARWGIIYNSTDTGKRAIGFVDLGAAIDLSAGNFSITWNASGISSMDQA